MIKKFIEESSWRMRKKKRRTLDFILYGVPRSGTSAFGGACNRNKHIFCGQECFPLSYDYRKMDIPLSFSKRFSSSESKPSINQKRFLENISTGEFKVFGNKEPRYYFILDKVNRYNPNLKNVFIYRKPNEFVHSWDKRTEAANAWHKGQVGIFGIFELFMCLYRIANTNHELKILNYHDAFFKQDHLMSEVISYLDPGNHDENFQMKFREMFNKPVLAKKKLPPSSAFYEEIFKEHNIDDLNLIMSKHGFADKSKYIPEISDFLTENGGGFLNKFPQYVAAFGKESKEYYRVWQDQIQRVYDNKKDVSYQFFDQLPKAL